MVSASRLAAWCCSRLRFQSQMTACTSCSWGKQRWSLAVRARLSACLDTYFQTDQGMMGFWCQVFVYLLACLCLCTCHSTHACLPALPLKQSGHARVTAWCLTRNSGSPWCPCSRCCGPAEQQKCRRGQKGGGPHCAHPTEARLGVWRRGAAVPLPTYSQCHGKDQYCGLGPGQKDLPAVCNEACTGRTELTPRSLSLSQQPPNL